MNVPSSDALPLAASRTPPPFRRWQAIPAFISALAALLVYSITLAGSYVYDDVVIFHEDTRLTHPAQWIHYWTQPYMPGAVDQLYRPLTCMTFAIEYWIHGDRPWIYHLVNILLHAGVAAAVAELARRLFGYRVAIGAGLLFAVHPVHVEAVAGLVGRAELHCTLFSLGAMIVFLGRMTVRRAVVITLCTLLAILSKEQGILLPAMLLALVPMRRRIVAACGFANANRDLVESERRNSRGVREAASGNAFCDARSAQFNEQLSNIFSTSDNRTLERGAMHLLVALLCLTVAGYLIFREQMFGFTWDRNALDWTANPLIRSTGLDRVLMPSVLLGRYVLLLVAPVKLSLDYGTHVIGWTVNWNQPYVYIGAVTVLAWILALKWSLCRRWAVMFCLVSLAVSYGMVSNSFILIGTIMGERLMYLPSVFFVILVTALLWRFCDTGVPPVLARSKFECESADKVTPPARAGRPCHDTIFAALVVVLAILGSIRTVTYARLWNDPLKLYLADLQDHPMSMHLHSLCVDRYLACGNYQAARRMGEDSLRLLPDCWDSYRMCVVADLKMHDFDDAERVLANPDRRCPALKIMLLRDAVQNARDEYKKVSANSVK